MHTPPTAGSFFAISSKTSVKGVIGYPAKNLQPAATIASAIASLPWSSRRWVGERTGRMETVDPLT
jgi:hypothetical protein